jgi:hypothetical protein
VQVIMQAQKEVPAECKDKFMVQRAHVNPRDSGADFNALFEGGAAAGVSEVKVAAQYVWPATPPGLPLQVCALPAAAPAAAVVAAAKARADADDAAAVLRVAAAKEVQAVAARAAQEETARTQAAAAAAAAAAAKAHVEADAAFADARSVRDGDCAGARSPAAAASPLLRSAAARLRRRSASSALRAAAASAAACASRRLRLLCVPLTPLRWRYLAAQR